MIATLAIFLCANRTYAQKSSFFLEQQNVYNHSTEKVTPNLFIWASTDISKHWGLFSFGMANNGWGELYAGPRYFTGIKNGIIEFGYGIGFESSKNKGPRNALYVFGETKKNNQLVKSKNQFMIYTEHGPNGPWAFAYYTYGLTKRISVGVHSQRFSATGPRVQLDFAKRLMVYVVPGKNIETGEWAGQLGLRAYF